MVNHVDERIVMLKEEKYEHVIQVGLSGWGDHDKLYDEGARPSDRLEMYSRHFPSWRWTIRSMPYRQRNK